MPSPNDRRSATEGHRRAPVVRRFVAGVAVAALVGGFVWLLDVPSMGLLSCRRRGSI